MKTEHYFLIALAVIIVGGIAYAFAGTNTGTNADTSPATGDTIQKKLPVSNTDSMETKETGSTDSEGVLIELTPHKSKDGRLVVDFAANTHSVDLSQFDLYEIVTLTSDGQTYKPVEALSMGGHHNSGNIVFEIGDITEFTIKITGIPNELERIFTWR